MPTKVSEYMARKVVTVTEDTGIREAFFLMKENRIRHLPVVDADKKMVGFISDRELRRPNWVDEAHDIAHIYYLDDNMLIRDVMIRNVHVLHTYDSLSKAVKLFLRNRIGAAPVLDKTGNMVGLVSAVDLLRSLGDILNDQKENK